jgi:hypothetical protein
MPSFVGTFVTVMPGIDLDLFQGYGASVTKVVSDLLQGYMKMQIVAMLGHMLRGDMLLRQSGHGRLALQVGKAHSWWI